MGNAIVANKRPTLSCKKKNLVSTAKYFWPIGDRNNGSSTLSNVLHV